jgi:hypothetical protein
MAQCIVKRNFRSQNIGTCQKCVKDTLRPKSSLGNNVTSSPKFSQNISALCQEGSCCQGGVDLCLLSEGVTETKKKFLYDVREARVEHYKLDWDHGS